MNRSRWLVVLSIVLALSFVFSACAPAATPTPPPQPTKASEPTKAAEPVELRIAWWGSQARHDSTIKAIEAFQKEYPHIKITYEFAGWADYWTKMTTQAAGNNLPDIMQQDYAYIGEWTSRGLVIPLDDLVASGKLNLADVTDAELAGGRVDGKLMAINLGSNSQVWVIDADAFAKAGVELPKPDWTWADLEKAATQLHEKLGIWGMGWGLWDEQIWGSIYLSAGTWRYNKEGTALGYTDDQPYIDHLKMALRLQESGASLPRAEDLATYDGKGIESRPIVEGKAAMDYMHSNQVISVWQAAGEDTRNIVMATVPRVVGGKSANYIKPSMFWSITSQSKHPEEAALFIDWFTNSIEANEILMAERGVPISSKVREALKPKLGKAQAAMFDYVDQVSKIAQPIPPADPPGHTDIVKNVFRAQVVDPVAYGQLTPEEAVKILRQEADAILAQNKK